VEEGAGMKSTPEPVFIFFTELASRIYGDRTGSERDRVIHLLEYWRLKQTRAMFADPSQRQSRSVGQAIDLAIEITKNAFIPPWERSE